MDIPEMMESTLFRLPACDHRRKTLPMLMLGKCSKNQRITFSSASNLMVQTSELGQTRIIRTSERLTVIHTKALILAYCFLSSWQANSMSFMYSGSETILAKAMEAASFAASTSLT